jgi:competence protein ComEC
VIRPRLEARRAAALADVRRARLWLLRHPHLPVIAAAASGLACAVRPLVASVVAAALFALTFVARTRAVPGAVSSRGLLCVCAATVAASALLGALRVHTIDRTAERVAPGTHVETKGVVLERPRTSQFATSAAVELRGGPADGTKVFARAPRRMRWPAGGAPGTVVRVGGLAREPLRASDSDFDWPAHLRRRGIAVELELTTLQATGERRGGVAGAVDTMRSRAERTLAAGRSPSEEALMRGMVLGQDEAIAETVRDDFRASGLAHLLAVSGQNIMLLAALALPLLIAVGASHGARALTLLGLIAIYVPLAGAGPSLQRAGVTGAAGAIAMAASRPASRWYALGLAAVITLGLNPRACGDPGWQLSFAAVAGILLLGRPLRDAFIGHVTSKDSDDDQPAAQVRAHRQSARRVLAEGAAITIAATVATAPLLAHHFGTVSIASLFANLLALPAVPLIMWSGMCVTAVAQLPALVPAAAGPIETLASTAAAVDGIALGYLTWIAERFATAPGATVEIRLASPGAVVGAYAGMAVTALVARRYARRAEPWVSSTRAAWQRVPGPRRLAAGAAVAGAATLALAGWTGTPGAPDDLTVSFLDVGQGDATLIQAPGGTAVLFDGGPPEARVTRTLHRAGVRRLAMVVMTHQSRDHHAGLQEVVDRYPVDTLVENGDGTRDASFWKIVETARRRGARIVTGTGGQTYRLGVGGRLVVRILGPPPRPPGPPPEDPNPRALVTVVSYGGFDLFLSGDAESEVLGSYDLPDVEAMKVAHHGSDDPGLPQLLERLKPQVAAIEVGEDNSYGHPTPSTLAALKKVVPRVYRTDRDGTVKLTVVGGGMRLATAR